MQYLLTDEEFTRLHKAKAEVEAEIKKKFEAELQDLCTDVCNYKPVEGWHARSYDGNKAPWGCVRTEEEWYCDLCPVVSLCPYDRKSYSQ